MSYIMVDIESDGPIPGDYSMVCFGAVVVEPGLNRTFYGRLRPISERFIPEALAVSGFTREQVLAFDAPEVVMKQFTWGSGSRGHWGLVIGATNFESPYGGEPWQPGVYFWRNDR